MKSILACGILFCYLLASIGQVEQVHICLSEVIPASTNLFEKGASCCDSDVDEMGELPIKSASDCCKDQSQFKKIFAGKADLYSLKIGKVEVLVLGIFNMPKLIFEQVNQVSKAFISIPLPNAPPPNWVAIYILFMQWKFDVC
jgi:hypothetical protein